MSKRIMDMITDAAIANAKEIAKASINDGNMASASALPTRGRFLDYRLTPRDVDKIMQSRASGRTYGGTVREGQTVSGFVTSAESQPRAANIDGENAFTFVRVVNLKLFLDGNDFHYVQDVTMGPDCGQAQWPVRS